MMEIEAFVAQIVVNADMAEVEDYQTIEDASYFKRICAGYGSSAIENKLNTTTYTTLTSQIHTLHLLHDHGAVNCLVNDLQLPVVLIW